MDSARQPVSVKTIFADELEGYLRGLREEDFVLVDVREPEEYKAGHIPGARLIPLREIEQRLHELDPRKEVILYCSAGGRSRAAAAFIADSGLSPRAVTNLKGGYLAWDGKPLQGFPRTRAFRKAATPAEILENAVDLEKGAWRFYAAVVRRFPDSPFARAAETLTGMERAHARVAFEYLKKASGDRSWPPFDAYFDVLSGELLEGGEPLEEALKRLETLPLNRCSAFAELALDIESNAYDLYRNLAAELRDPEAQRAFLALAEQEKGHLRLLARVFNKCGD